MKKMIIAACILTLAAFSAAGLGGAEREDTKNPINSSNESTPPPIDIAAPAAVETATFGLG